MHMNLSILILCLVIMVSTTILNRISSKIGIPALLAFIVLGMCFGRDGIFNFDISSVKLAEQACTIALIFIMFYGGFGTNWNMIRPVFKKATLMASLGTVLTALLIGVFCRFVLMIPTFEAFLLGSVVSSTDAASVFSILKSENLSLKNNTDSLLEMESGANDPFAFMLTIGVISMIQGEASGSAIIILLIQQIFFGIVIGLVLAFLTLKTLEEFRFEDEGFQLAFMIAIALLSYTLPNSIGGNGFLSTYIVGVYLGNKLTLNKKSMVHMFDGITSLMQIMTFFILGILASPIEIVRNLPMGIVITIFIAFIARPLASYVILRPQRASTGQIAVVSWAGLRGASSIVFATMATVSVNNLSTDIFHTVFCVVILSILILGTTLKKVSSKMQMIDPEGNIFKTFNDYSEEVDMDFVSATIDANSIWVGKSVKSMGLPSDLLIALINRDGLEIIPNGKTIIRENDELVISASTFNRHLYDIDLKEILIDRNHQWKNKTLAEVTIPENFLVIMIKRNTKTIVPNGSTVLREGDTIVLNTFKKRRK